MGTVTSVNPGVADLLQIISNAGSPTLSSTLSSSGVQSALQNASPADLVQLSDQALQLQLSNDLFGGQDPSQTDGLFSSLSPSSSSATLDNLLAALNPSALGSTSSPTSSGALLNNILTTLNPSSAGSATANTTTPSLADQLGAYQGQLQSEQVQALFGTNTNAGTSGTLLNVLG